MSQKHLQILLVEDNEDDALLLIRELRRGGYNITIERVETAAAMQFQLEQQKWDFIISDYSLPNFSAPEALKVLQKTGLDLPLIIVSGQIGEDAAVAAMKAGAHDYVMKNKLARLVPVVERELREAKMRAERRQAEVARRETEQRFRALIENAADIIAIVDAEGRFRYVSPSQERTFGYAPEELLGRPCWEFVHPEDVSTVLATLNRSLAQPRISQRASECRIFARNGSLYFIESVTTNLLDEPAVRGLVINCHNITDRKIVEEQLRFFAFYDPLTSLPSRALFLERLEQSIQQNKAKLNDSLPQNLFAVLFLNLDRFDVIKYSLGHLVADRLLVAVALRLIEEVSYTDIVARVGTDEFAVLLTQIPNTSYPQSIAEQIHRSLIVPFNLEGREVFTTTNIGIVLSTIEYERPEDYLRAADTAMYHAKLQGKSGSAFFDVAMHSRAIARLQLETDLRLAIERQEFVLHYQPIVSLSTGRLLGFEALVRWVHPQFGLISPAAFIPAAEETGLILPLGGWVLREACNQLAQWRTQFPATSSLTMSVNLAGLQLIQPDTLEQIDRILQETGLPGCCLKLELTESILIEIAEATPTLLQQLKARQIKLSIDDFGTGYSSLSRLHQWPLDTLKIDRSFVSRLGTIGDGSEMVWIIITLAHNLGLEAIAEGVETEKQAFLLRQLQCQAGQGYFFSKPLDSEAAKDWIVKISHIA